MPTLLKNSRILLLNTPKGADLNARDYYNRTPLHRAVVGDKKEIVELLIARGANVNAKDKHGSTPLSHASDLEIVKLLKQQGATVFRTDRRD